MISVKIDWKDKKKFDNLIQSISSNEIYGEMQIQAQILAHHCADYMIEHIKSHKKHPMVGYETLENTITAELITTTGGIEYGIGNINMLVMRAPYFELINDGGTYITKTTHVVPFEDGTYRTFKAGSSHTIEGIDYVGYSINKIRHELIDLTLKNVSEKLNKIMSEASK